MHPPVQRFSHLITQKVALQDIIKGYEYEKDKYVVMTARLPASFVAYDCLQVGDRVLLDAPLLDRKQILNELISENERIAISGYIEEKGHNYFN